MNKPTHIGDAARRNSVALKCAISIASVLLVIWLPLLVFTVTAMASPEMDYLKPARVFRSIVQMYPFVIAAVLLSIWLFRRSMLLAALFVAILWITMTGTLGALAYYGVSVALADKLEADLFEHKYQQELIKSILDGDVNAILEHIRSDNNLTFSGKRGINPLYVAIVKDRWNIVELLLQAGYDLNHRPNGGTRFFAPAYVLFRMTENPDSSSRMKQFLTMLLDAGLDPNLIVGGQSLVQCAVDSDSVEGVRLLVQRGANTSIVDAQGDTPLESAVRFGRWMCADVLFQYTNPRESDRAWAIMKEQELRNDPGLSWPERAAFRRRLMSTIEER